MSAGQKFNANTKRGSWLNRTVLGIGLASLFSDWSHEIATTTQKLAPELGATKAASVAIGLYVLHTPADRAAKEVTLRLQCSPNRRNLRHHRARIAMGQKMNMNLTPPA